MISYIFSGFDVKEHFGNDVSEYFKKDMKECKSITFIPGSFEDLDKVKRYVSTDVEWFKEIGIDLEEVNILDDNTEEDVMIDNIKNADIIFIMGGDTQRQNLFLERYKLKKMIKEANGIVIGVSAGAINLGGISLCSRDPDDGVNETITYRGIERIDYTIEPHFDLNNLDLLNNELYPISNNIKIYGLPNDTGIRITNADYDIIKGDFYLIYKNGVEKL